MNLRLLTYNIHGCKDVYGCDSEKNLLEIIQSVDADIVALQEVERHDKPDLDFLERINALGYTKIIYGKTMRRSDCDYGNLLLIRGERVRATSRVYVNFSNEPRGLVLAHFNKGPMRIQVANTHLGLKASERKSQAEELIAALSELSESPSPQLTILLGDLNEWLPSRAYFQRLCTSFEYKTEVRTFPSRLPIFALDRVFIRGPLLNVAPLRIGHKHMTTASDHRPLALELTTLT